MNTRTTAASALASGIGHPLHPLPLRLASAAVAVWLLAASSSWAGVTQGTSYGAFADAGGVRQGGEYQSSSTALYAQASGNTRALASAMSDGFLLRALAWTSANPTLPASCSVYTCSWQTYAHATVWDTVTLTAPADGQAQEFHYDFAVGGTKTRGPWAYGDGAYAYARTYFGSDPNGWTTRPLVTLPSGATVVRGTFTMQPGETQTLFLMGHLEVTARDGAVSDYSHTMAFHWDVPSSYTYTSASGRFAPSPVPEPDSLALMAGGLFGLGVWKRRRLHDGR